MIRKLTLAVGFGAGYVLGAKAGKERYAQIEAKFRDLMGQPAVQDLTSNVSSTASAAAEKARTTVNEKVEAVGDKVGGSSSSSSGSSSSSSGSTAPLTGASGTGAAVGGAAAGGVVADEVVVVDLSPETGPIVGASPSSTAPDVL